jgi:hypothetical protein
MVNIDNLVNEWAYRCEKGYPDLDSPSDLRVLKSILKEQGISLPEQQLSLFSEDEMAQMIKKDTGVDIKMIDNEKELERVFDKLSPEVAKKLEIDTLDGRREAINMVLNKRSKSKILDILAKKDWHEKIVPQWSKELAGLVEDVPENDRETFLTYIEDESKQQVFPKTRDGNFESLLSKTKINPSIINRIIRFTAQDEKKLGVGMGEVALAMFFKNVSASAGKGDLTLNGDEFEIKGFNATLGEKPGDFKVDSNKIKKLGIELKTGKVRLKSGKLQNQTKLVVDGEQFEPGKLPTLLSKMYKNSTNKEQFEEDLKDILLNDIKLGIGVEARFNKIDFSDINSINKNIALMNFVRYATKEGFTHFLTHDYGGASAAPDNGEYVYVFGTPESMADQLFDSDAYFQGIGINNLRPRIRYKG